ncbi:MAG: hypothetical protein ABIS68_10060 [Casimicrobiaceae bacterium]
MNATRSLTVACIAAILAACAPSPPLTITPKSEKATSPVIREEIPAPAQPAPTPTPATAPIAGNPQPTGGAPTLANVAPSSAAAAPATFFPPAVPPGTLYVCAATVDGQPKHTAIEYVPKVRDLCAKHPEMGVCQYERVACRQSGGRVFDARGVEITNQTEAEYDKKVMRVRFRAG